MHMNLSTSPLILLVLAITACTTPAGGRWPAEGVVSPSSANSAAKTVPDDKLAVVVVPERSRYLVGEPVYVAVRLRNAGDRAERVVDSLYPQDGAVDLVIRDPRGREFTFVPFGETDRDAEGWTSLAPGESIGNLVPVFFGGGGWTFREPGFYRIVAYFRLAAGNGTNRVAKSAPATIEISSTPEGKALVAENMEESIEVGKFLVWQAGDHLTRGQTKLRDLIDRAPSSPLASYAHFAFGRSSSDSFMDYRKRAVRAPDCGAALAHFGKVNDAHVTDYVRAQIAISKGRCAAFENNAKTAIRHFSVAKSVMAGRPEYRAVGMRVVEYEKHLTR